MQLFINGCSAPASAKPRSEDTALYFWPMEQAREALAALREAGIRPAEREESSSSRFESHPGFDALLMCLPDKSEDIEAAPLHVDVYLAQRRLFVLYDERSTVQDFVDALLQGMPAGSENHETLAAHVAGALLSHTTARDTRMLESIEEEIARLEDMLAAGASADYFEAISALRRRLLKLKRYYESLLGALDDFAENENSLLDKPALKRLHVVENRVDRLFHSVLNLRDYVTQVREAYQNQIDISLNQTMKLFTVITSIFLPLSFVTGWFGMNLVMPEINQPITYPIVIGVCLLMVVGCLLLFKKRRWF